MKFNKIATMIQKLFFLVTLCSLQQNKGIEVTNDQDIINYVVAHPHVDYLQISFDSNIPSDRQSRILRDSFEQLAEQNRTQQITGLNLSFNELTELPKLTGLTSLEMLNLEHNRLAESPVLFGLPALQKLYLTGNPITLTFEEPIYIPVALKNQLRIYGSHNKLVYVNLRDSWLTKNLKPR